MKLDMLLSLFRPTVAANTASKTGTAQEKDIGAFQKLFSGLLKKPAAQTVEANASTLKPQNPTTAVLDAQSESSLPANGADKSVDRNSSAKTNIASAATVIKQKTKATATTVESEKTAILSNPGLPVNIVQAKADAPTPIRTSAKQTPVLSESLAVAKSESTITPKNVQTETRKPASSVGPSAVLSTDNTEKQYKDAAMMPQVSSNTKNIRQSSSSNNAVSAKAPESSRSISGIANAAASVARASTGTQPSETARTATHEAKERIPSDATIKRTPVTQSAVAEQTNVSAPANLSESISKTTVAGTAASFAKPVPRPTTAPINTTRNENEPASNPISLGKPSRVSEPARPLSTVAQSAVTDLPRMQERVASNDAGQSGRTTRAEQQTTAPQTLTNHVSSKVAGDNSATSLVGSTVSVKPSRSIGEFSSVAGSAAVIHERSISASDSRPLENQTVVRKQSKSESIANLTTGLQKNEKLYPENSIKKPVVRASERTSNALPNQEAAKQTISLAKDQISEKIPSATVSTVSDKPAAPVQSRNEAGRATNTRASVETLTASPVTSDAPLISKEKPVTAEKVRTSETFIPRSSERSISAGTLPRTDGSSKTPHNLPPVSDSTAGTVVEKASVPSQESNPTSILKSIWSEHVLPAGEKVAQILSIPGVIRSIANWNSDSPPKTEAKNATPQSGNEIRSQSAPLNPVVTRRVAQKADSISRSADPTAISTVKVPVVEKRTDLFSPSNKVDTDQVVVKETAKYDTKKTSEKIPQAESASGTIQATPSRTLWGLKFGHKTSEAVRDTVLPVQEQFIERIPTDRPTKSAAIPSSVVSRSDDVTSEHTIQTAPEKGGVVASVRKDTSTKAEPTSESILTSGKSDLYPNQNLESSQKDPIQKSDSKPRRENERGRSDEKTTSDPITGSEYTRETIRAQRGNPTRTFVESASASAQKSEPVYSAPADPTPFSNSRENTTTARSSAQSSSTASPVVKTEAPQSQGQSGQEATQNHQGAGTQTATQDLQTISASSRPEFTTFAPRLTAENIRELQALVQKALESSRSAVQNGSESVFEWRQSELGLLRFAISTSENNVRISIQADRSEVADAIDQSRAVVERMITDQGLKIERFDVQLRTPEDGQNRSGSFADHHPQAQEKQENPGSQRPTASPTQPQSGETNSPQRRVIPGEREWVA